MLPNPMYYWLISFVFKCFQHTLPWKWSQFWGRSKVDKMKANPSGILQGTNRQVIRYNHNKDLENKVSYSLCKSNQYQEWRLPSSRFLQAEEWEMIVEYLKITELSSKSSCFIVSLLSILLIVLSFWLNARIEKQFILTVLLAYSVLIWRQGVLEFPTLSFSLI